MTARNARVAVGAGGVSIDGGEKSAERSFESEHPRDEDGKFTFKEKGLDSSGDSGIMKAEVEKGNIKLKINHEKQARHIKGTKEYKEGKSYLTISEAEAQNIIIQKSGTGKITKNQDGRPTKEKIQCDKVIGVDVDQYTKKETVTDKGTIHYSNTGTHLVPRKETPDGNKS